MTRDFEGEYLAARIQANLPTGTAAWRSQWQDRSTRIAVAARRHGIHIDKSRLDDLAHQFWTKEITS